MFYLIQITNEINNQHGYTYCLLSLNMYNQIQETLHTVECQHVVKFKIAVLCPHTKQSKIRNTD